MPNWCSGYVSIKGKKVDAMNFCKLFLYDRENEDVLYHPVPEKYFARSFVQQTWESFKEEYFNDLEDNDKVDMSFNVDFAWSVYSCIIEGYPNGKECVTLEWACKEYDVYVEIEGEEEGMCFEEKVICDRGELEYSTKDMQEYTCQNCGYTQVIASSYDLEDVSCLECNTHGDWVDHMKLMIEERLERD